MSEDKDHEWLKARTIHVKGIPAEDRTGNGLKQVIDTFLEDKGGAVVAVSIVPPFHRIFEIETKTRDLKYLNMLLSSGDEQYYCCLPTKYKDI
jgi:hypothetical protein